MELLARSNNYLIERRLHKLTNFQLGASSVPKTDALYVLILVELKKFAIVVVKKRSKEKADGKFIKALSKFSDFVNHRKTFIFKSHPNSSAIVFEVNWSDIQGIDYISPLHNDARLVLEAKTVVKREFVTVNDVHAYYNCRPYSSLHPHPAHPHACELCAYRPRPVRRYNFRARSAGGAYDGAEAAVLGTPVTAAAGHRASASAFSAERQGPALRREVIATDIPNRSRYVRRQLYGTLVHSTDDEKAGARGAGGRRWARARGAASPRVSISAPTAVPAAAPTAGGSSSSSSSRPTGNSNENVSSNGGDDRNNTSIDHDHDSECSSVEISFQANAVESFPGAEGSVKVKNLDHLLNSPTRIQSVAAVAAAEEAASSPPRCFSFGVHANGSAMRSGKAAPGEGVEARSPPTPVLEPPLSAPGQLSKSRSSAKVAAVTAQSSAPADALPPHARLSLGGEIEQGSLKRSRSRSGARRGEGGLEADRRDDGGAATTVLSGGTLVLCFKDPFLHQALRQFVKSEIRILKMYESGLPAWAILLPCYGLWYRPWLRQLTWILFIAVSFFSMACGFYDLYKNVPFLKQAIATVAARLYIPTALIFDWLERHTQIRLSILLTYLFSKSPLLLSVVRVVQNTANLLSQLLRPIVAGVLGAVQPLVVLLVRAAGDSWTIVESAATLVLVAAQCVGTWLSILLGPLLQTLMFLAQTLTQLVTAVVLACRLVLGLPFDFAVAILRSLSALLSLLMNQAMVLLEVARWAGAAAAAAWKFVMGMRPAVMSAGRVLKSAAAVHQAAAPSLASAIVGTGAGGGSGASFLASLELVHWFNFEVVGALQLLKQASLGLLKSLQAVINAVVSLGLAVNQHRCSLQLQLNYLCQRQRRRRHGSPTLSLRTRRGSAEEADDTMRVDGSGNERTDTRVATPSHLLRVDSTTGDDVIGGLLPTPTTAANQDLEAKQHLQSLFDELPVTPCDDPETATASDVAETPDDALFLPRRIGFHESKRGRHGGREGGREGDRTSPGLGSAGKRKAALGHGSIIRARRRFMPGDDADDDDVSGGGGADASAIRRESNSDIADSPTFVLELTPISKQLLEDSGIGQDVHISSTGWLRRRRRTTTTTGADETPPRRLVAARSHPEMTSLLSPEAEVSSPQASRRH